MSIDVCALPLVRDARCADILVCLHALHESRAASRAARSDELSSVPTLILPLILNLALHALFGRGFRENTPCMHKIVP